MNAVQSAVTARLSQIRRQWSRLRDFFEGPPDADAPPLEICCAVLDELERRVQPVGGGRRVFPYNRVIVRIGPVTADRPALQAAFEGLGARLQARLEELKCEAPETIDVKPMFLAEPSGEWPPGRVFSIECEREGMAAGDPGQQRRSALCVAVLSGAAGEATYRFEAPTIHVGRTAEATDGSGRVRRNDVAFLDHADGVTETVGRAHARFRRDEPDGEYRLYDEGSRNGTWIIRRGATIAVPARDPRGVRVESGDEVRLGRALIRISIEVEA